MARFLNLNTEAFSNLDDQKCEVIDKLTNEDTIQPYLDNVEDVKHAVDTGNEEAKKLMRFFEKIPENVKILTTSRIVLGWDNEQLFKLGDLIPHDGAEVFRQWTPHRQQNL